MASGIVTSLQDEGRWIPPWLLRAFAVGFGLAGLVLPAMAVRWLTMNAPLTETSDAGTLRPEMVVVPAGTYTMGSPEDEPLRLDNEQQHRVSLSRPFAIAITEVTQAQYLRVMGENPSEDQSCGKDCPVTNVTWFDAIRYLNELSARDDSVEPCYQIEGDEVEWIEGCAGYRLPTEAEWEIAARAESDAAYAGTDELTDVCDFGNVADATFKTTRPDWQFPTFACEDEFANLAPVAQFSPNGFRLYDMTGNVWEWVWDWYLRDGYQDGAVDPQGPVSGRNRVIRGGSFDDFPQGARVAYRSFDEPSFRGRYVGFRVARSLP